MEIMLMQLMLISAKLLQIRKLILSPDHWDGNIWGDLNDYD